MIAYECKTCGAIILGRTEFEADMRFIEHKCDNPRIDDDDDSQESNRRSEGEEAS